MLVTGVDIVELHRIARVVERYGDRFLRRIYTQGEVDFCRGRIPQLAGRFAAKEAVMKALGTGIRGVGWREVEVVRKRGQAPQVQLHGRAQLKAEALGLQELSLTTSHSKDYAVAFVVGVRDEVSNR
ncbi:MAG: holo-[acyl-carrier protein] synthase [Chloroflexi bacterium]|jgi:holo-[acyl-carrier protein] synthase|nr:MAG: holo-[acyl-carrier protein] synthase [Chloroflexota bacterium]